MKPAILLSDADFCSIKKLRSICIVCCFTFLLANCTDKESNTVQSAGNVIKESPLPPGIAALEDEVNIITTGNTETGMLGAADSTTDKSGLTKIDLSDKELLKRKFKNLLMFHADDTMQVNQSKLATLILSKDELLGNIKREVLEESNSTRENATKVDTMVDLGSKMKARLISFGNSGLENSFAIEALGDDVQSFKTDRKKIIWQWKITPLKPGNQELKLSIQIIQKDGENVSLPARNIDVMILVKPESTMAKVGKFIENYWQFLITGLLIPIISAWISNIVKNRTPKQKKDPPKDPPAPVSNMSAGSSPHSAY